MLTITLIGTGTVSQHLQKAFSKTNEVQVIQVLSGRSPSLIKEVKKNISDIYILTISDDAIESVAQKLKGNGLLLVHTSGSVNISAISNQRRGVFYPLQTFSKERKVDFSEVPICIEAEKNTDIKLLEKLAKNISKKVFRISSDQRRSLHLAAVFANNFANHLYQISQTICEANEVSFEIVKPLITETAAKVLQHDPSKMQTGPAIRNDKQTITRHLEQLQNKTHKKVYQLLTNSIQEFHGKKL